MGIFQQFFENQGPTPGIGSHPSLVEFVSRFDNPELKVVFLQANHHSAEAIAVAEIFQFLHRAHCMTEKFSPTRSDMLYIQSLGTILLFYFAHLRNLLDSFEEDAEEIQETAEVLRESGRQIGLLLEASKLIPASDFFTLGPKRGLSIFGRLEDFSEEAGERLLEEEALKHRYVLERGSLPFSAPLRMQALHPDIRKEVEVLKHGIPSLHDRILQSLARYGELRRRHEEKAPSVLYEQVKPPIFWAASHYPYSHIVPKPYPYSKVLNLLVGFSYAEEMDSFFNREGIPWEEKEAVLIGCRACAVVRKFFEQERDASLFNDAVVTEMLYAVLTLMLNAEISRRNPYRECGEFEYLFSIQRALYRFGQSIEGLAFENYRFDRYLFCKTPYTLNQSVLKRFLVFNLALAYNLKIPVSATLLTPAQYQADKRFTHFFLKAQQTIHAISLLIPETFSGLRKELAELAKEYKAKMGVESLERTSDFHKKLFPLCYGNVTEIKDAPLCEFFAKFSHPLEFNQLIFLGFPNPPQPLSLESSAVYSWLNKEDPFKSEQDLARFKGLNTSFAILVLSFMLARKYLPASPSPLMREDKALLTLGFLFSHLLRDKVPMDFKEVSRGYMGGSFRLWVNALCPYAEIRSGDASFIPEKDNTDEFLHVMLEHLFSSEGEEHVCPAKKEEYEKALADYFAELKGIEEEAVREVARYSNLYWRIRDGAYLFPKSK